MQQKLGKWSLRFTEAPFILESSSVVGTKEADGPLGGLFDIVGKDDRFGQNTWEKAESSMQRDALTMALGKAHLDASDMDYVFAGDLLGQSMATTFGVENFRIPWFGVYGACSTCGESLSLAAAFVAAGYARHAVAVTSSHFGSAEKQFRFPNQYAIDIILCLVVCCSWILCQNMLHSNAGVFIHTAFECLIAPDNMHRIPSVLCGKAI
jgi:stage V sporulation protein AD